MHRQVDKDDREAGHAKKNVWQAQAGFKGLQPVVGGPGLGEVALLGSLSHK